MKSNIGSTNGRSFIVVRLEAANCFMHIYGLEVLIYRHATPIVYL